MAYIIDTYAWIEYFHGSRMGERVKTIVESQRNFTPTIVLAELKKKFVDESRTDFDQTLSFIHEHSEILQLDESTAILAGEIRSTTRIVGIGIVDCILIALARMYNCKVLTADEHFEKLSEAEYLKRDGVK